MGDKMIRDSAEPRLESLYTLFVTGIGLPHQGVLDSNSPADWGVGKDFGDSKVWEEASA